MRAAVVVAVALLTVSGCADERDEASTPARSARASATRSTTSPTPTVQAETSTPTTPVPTDAADARRLLDRALTDLAGESAIGFRVSFFLGDRVVNSVLGNGYPGGSWDATASGDVGSDDPAYDNPGYSMSVRSIGATTWMQLRGWPEEMQGCWLRLGAGQVPLDQQALRAGAPTYLTALDFLQTVGFIPGDPSLQVLSGQLDLGVGLSYLPGPLLDLIDLAPTRTRRATTPVTLTLSDGVFGTVVVSGAALRDAVAAAGGTVDPRASEALAAISVRVAYDATGGSPVDPPPAELVVSQAEADEGCRGPAS